MDRVLPPTWRPSSEAELEAALNEGAFTETPKREAKQQLRSSKDQAKDMASFAIDGGLIVVGVREVKTEGRFELAPVQWVDQILETVQALKRDGLTILLVEQNAHAALAIADRAYVLETGRITAAGTAAEIRFDPRVREAYLGV